MWTAWSTTEEHAVNGKRLASNHIDLIFGWEHRCGVWRHKKTK